MYIKQIILAWLLNFLCLGASAQSTETIYLSGRDADQTVMWDFFCSKGNHSGKWRKIAVPSCWEHSRDSANIHTAGITRRKMEG